MEISTDFPIVVSEEQTVLTRVLVRVIYDERYQGRSARQYLSVSIGRRARITCFTRSCNGHRQYGKTDVQDARPRRAPFVCTGIGGVGRRADRAEDGVFFVGPN